MHLNISGNRITSIRRTFFEGFSTTHLQELDLNNNDISNIELDAFQNLNYLHTLDLSGNSIKDLLQTTFRGLNSVRKLYLFNNDISNIQTRTFDGLHNLEELDLSGNALQSFSGDVFSSSRVLSPRKLRKLLLRRNNLHFIEPRTFSQLINLDYLSLSFNSIDQLDENLFLPLAKLKKLHINHNNLEELSNNLFNTTFQLQELLIDHNKLSFLPEITNDFSRLTKVTVEGNPWQCPCLNEIRGWLQHRGIEYNGRTDNPYYTGQKPICVLTLSNDCIRNKDDPKLFRIVERYENALN